MDNTYMHTPRPKQPKYRPSLTATMVTKILALAKTESPMSYESVELIKTLAPFEAKIANAAITASHTAAKPVTVEELGGAEQTGQTGAAPSNTPYDTEHASGAFTKEQRWEFCYNKFKAHPEACSLEEIANADEHAYLHGLMSPAELEAFETKQFGEM